MIPDEVLEGVEGGSGAPFWLHTEDCFTINVSSSFSAIFLSSSISPIERGTAMTTERRGFTGDFVDRRSADGVDCVELDVEVFWEGAFVGVEGHSKPGKAPVAAADTSSA
eukprot:CAMPEP_0170589024 /NCGR_PEP_ID=MMETSP0224-20130122/11137_1 /TAXON_ID=285029 /ORGANISM="Togula jolla, Strain CCCM 725" /LENGTH=109 /DNA_ID=CAMNT_0010912769 /DNA_START=593 /DNA_END=922 /DNA_ORIENTATION=-